MAVLLHERPRTAGGKTRKTPNLPKTSAVVALFAFSSRLDRDTMSLFAKTHSDEVRAAAIAATGQEVLELLHGGLRPNVLVLDVSAAMAKRGEEPYRTLCLRSGRPADGVLSNGQLFKGLLKDLRDKTEQYL